MLSRNRIYAVLFAIFVVGYMLLLVVPPLGIGATDEFTFLRTLQLGKPHLYYAKDFPHYDFIEIGRFFPAGAMEYNLLLLFTNHPTPTLYYIVHAIQFAVLIFFLIRILENYTTNRKYVYLAIAALTLTAGFTYTWFRLQMNEHDIVLFLAAFLYCYLRYEKSRKSMWLVLAVIAANIAIHYKEMPSFLIGTYAAGNLILSARNHENDSRVRIFNFALIGSALIYLLLYAVLIYPHGGMSTYNNNDLPVVEIFVKNFLNYFFVSDPVIFLIVLPLTVWRIFRVYLRGDRAEPFHDSLLAAAAIYVLGHFVLNVTGDYYFQPAYIVALPPMFHFLRHRLELRAWRYALTAAIILVAVNTIPLGLHYLTYFKYAPANLGAAADFLVKDIKEHSLDRRANIFLDGVDRDTAGRWRYFVLSEHLLYKGLTAKEFDLKSNIGEYHETYFPYLGRIPTPFTVFEKGPLPAISKGDYLIVSLFSLDRNKMPDNTEYLKSLENDYKLVFSTKSRFAIPLLNLKEAGRYLISIGAKPGDRLFGISRHKPPSQIPDYYIFVHK